jgi:hypothetical protein
VGRQTQNSIDWAYIAGFLDGDGSLMAQIKNRRKTKRGWRLMFTICFYQDSRHGKPLKWIKNIIGIGYLSKRSDGITELRINGFTAVRKTLIALKPYVKFKSVQTRLMLKILSLIGNKNLARLDKKTRFKIADLISDLREQNYKSGKRKFNRIELRKILGF